MALAHETPEHLSVSVYSDKKFDSCRAEDTA